MGQPQRRSARNPAQNRHFQQILGRLVECHETSDIRHQEKFPPQRSRLPFKARNSPQHPGHPHPMQVEQRTVAELIPFARNSRTHSAEQVSQIAASIKEFGWTNPILIDADNGIIAGHGRILAARQLGMDTVPCIALAHLSPAQRRALVIADNKLALNAGWDMDLLGSEMAALGLDGFDLSLLGFNTDELAVLFADKTTGLTDADDIPEVPSVPVSRLGDVWLMGKHRIVCGDSTNAESVAKALNGSVPHLMVTDPPYGVKYDPNWRNGAVESFKGTMRATGLVDNDHEADWTKAWELFTGSVAYVWHAGNKANTVADSLQAVGLEIPAQIVWVKQHFAIGRGDYHPKHEPCWYVVRKGATGKWVGGRKQSTVWEINSLSPVGNKGGIAIHDGKTGHGTQKPVECMKRPIENNSKEGDAVYEPFSGSGTTIIAGEMTGRSIHAIELSPAYVDVAVNRWQAFTGKIATLEESGHTFADVATERLELTVA
jgi:DNA modification methylase